MIGLSSRLGNHSRDDPFTHAIHLLICPVAASGKYLCRACVSARNSSQAD